MSRKFFTLILAALMLAAASSPGFAKRPVKEVTFNFVMPDDFYEFEYTYDRVFDKKCEKQFTIRKIDSMYYGSMPDSCFSCDDMVLIAYLEDSTGEVEYTNPIVMIHDSSGFCISKECIDSTLVVKMDDAYRVGGAAVWMEIAKKLPSDSLTKICAQAFQKGKIGYIYAETEPTGTCTMAKGSQDSPLEPEEGAMTALYNLELQVDLNCEGIASNYHQIQDLQERVARLEKAINARLKHRQGCGGCNFEEGEGGILVLNLKSTIHEDVNINSDGNANVSIRVINRDDSQIEGSVNINVK